MNLMYKNIGTVTKEFYGVTFCPGEVKEVAGYINSPTFIRVHQNTTLKTSVTKPAIEPKPVQKSNDVKSSDPKKKDESKKVDEPKKIDESKKVEEPSTSE